MKKKLIAICLMICAANAQNLTKAQKEADFRFLASLYATYYAPLDWKKQLFQTDALALKPWIEKVAATKTDLDFYEVEAEYIASLNDTHVSLNLISDFTASLGFNVDLYDGVLLIDTISRGVLPARDYPFAIGDELVSIDGVEALKVAEQFMKYTPQGNRRSSLRRAAGRITARAQQVIPRAAEVGDKAEVVIRRQNGAVESYSIPWVKTGTPIEVGPTSSPRTTSRRPRGAAAAGEPGYMAPLREAQWSASIPDEQGVLGYGSRNPVFLAGLPATFTRRLGGSASDFFYSGTFKREELTIGYLRIPNYAPASTGTALLQLDRELAYMQANTDGMIVDEMRNTGGNLCLGEAIASRFISEPFVATSFALRPYWTRILGFYNAMVAAKEADENPDVVLMYEKLYNAMLSANRRGDLLTEPLPLCTASVLRTPNRDRDGNFIGYTKPVMLVIDEFSTSTADSFAGMMQDSRRAVLFGMRTNGAGGNNTTFDIGSYSEGYVGMTLALQMRQGWVGTADYPTTRYIENVGVRPDVEADYMTRDNLTQNGAPFIEDMLAHAAAYIRGKKQN